EVRGGAVGRGGALVGHEAQIADRDRKRERRPVADVAAALEPIEDAGADVAPGRVDARSSLQADRRDMRAGVEAKIDIDERQDAAEVEVQGTARARIRRRRGTGG